MTKSATPRRSSPLFWRDALDAVARGEEQSHPLPHSSASLSGGDREVFLSVFSRHFGSLPSAGRIVARSRSRGQDRQVRFTDLTENVAQLTSSVKRLEDRINTLEGENAELVSVIEQLTSALSKAVQIRRSGDRREEFNSLVEQWREDTFGQSLAAPGILHPAYLRIIGMGTQAIPWILHELEENGGQWYVALQSITGEDPIPEADRGHRPKMRAAWQSWGRRSGWID